MGARLEADTVWTQATCGVQILREPGQVSVQPVGWQESVPGGRLARSPGDQPGAVSTQGGNTRAAVSSVASVPALVPTNQVAVNKSPPLPWDLFS